MQEVFRKFAARVAGVTGTVWVFMAAIGVIVVWAVTGPVFGFSDTWQLIINTGTTIVTFLMVFLIQNTQNRDNRALHAKLDELIVHTRGAHNELAAAEDLTDQQLNKLHEHFDEVSQKGGTSSSDPLGLRVAAPPDHNGKPRAGGANGRRKAAAKR